MGSFILALIIFSLVTTFLVVVFWRLKKLTLYTMIIYSFIFLFTLAMQSLILNARMHLDTSWKKYLLPLSLALFHFAQALVRLPLGIMAQKLGTRKWPFLCALLGVVGGMIILVASNYAFWSIPLAYFGAGIFASSFGMQNQYIAESWEMKQIFISIGFVAIISPLASVFLHGLNALVHVNLTSQMAQNMLFWISFSSVISGLLYLIYNDQHPILADNILGFNLKVFNKKLKDVFFMTLTVICFSLVFQMLHPYAQKQVQGHFQAWIIIANFIVIVMALVSALVLIRWIKPYVLIISSHILTFLVLLYGFWLCFGPSNYLMWLSFLFLFTLITTIFQTTMLGTMLHFDRKNQLLVLSIWLTVRSLARGSGVFIGQELVLNQLWLAIKIVFILSCSLIIFSLVMSLSLYRKHNQVIYELVLKNEFHTYRSTQISPWKK